MLNKDLHKRDIFIFRNEQIIKFTRDSLDLGGLYKTLFFCFLSCFLLGDFSHKLELMLLKIIVDCFPCKT